MFEAKESTFHLEPFFKLLFQQSDSYTLNLFTSNCKSSAIDDNE